MAILKISINPSVPLQNDIPITYGLIRYICLDNPLTAEFNETSEGFIEEQFELSPQLEGELDIWDWDEKNPNIEFTIHTALGIEVFKPIQIQISGNELKTVDDIELGTIKIELTAKQIANIQKAVTPPDVDKIINALNRTGQFFIMGDKNFKFPDHILISSAKENDITAIFGQSSQKIIDSEKITGINEFSKISFTKVKLGLKGVFEFTIPWDKESKGWIWILPGSKNTAGYILEEKPFESRASIAILLSKESIGDSMQNQTDLNKKKSGCCNDPTVPLDASEEDLLTNADTYGEDPGTFCEPFRNPNRILSERVFSTIFRVKAPAIGGLSSYFPTPVKPLEIEPPPVVDKGTKIPKVPFFERIFGTKTTPSSASTTVVNKTAIANTSMLWTNVIKSKRGTVELYDKFKKEIPRFKIPPLLGSSRRKDVTASTPIDWEGDASKTQATTVGLGHILEFRLRWRSNGYSIGDVIHTLTLAPRQVKRITSIQWERTERATRSEISRQRDTVSQETTSERQYSDVVSSSLNEWSKGGSKSSTTGAAGGIGFAMGPVIIGGGVAHGQSSSSSWQSGGRDIAAQEEQSLRDAIRQYADSLRQFESSVVTEISQEEVVTGVSEVLRNPNYCHALTVVYHQILRHLRIDTELSGIRECIFVPFAIKQFDIVRALRWKDILTSRLLKSDLRWVVRYLDDVYTNFVGSTIPAGRRCDHPITFLSGSIFIKMAVQRPRDNEEDSYDESVWTVLRPFCGWPIFEVFTKLKALDKIKRDRYFQSEIAPSIVREWANTLTIADKYGNQIQNVDFTLASSYRFNNVVQVDFTCTDPQSISLTRSKIENLTVKATSPLSNGSIANLTNVKIHYETDTFQRDVSSLKSTNDLINPETGERDEQGAIARLRLDSWETQNLQDEIKRNAALLINHLNEHIEYYHKCIWWSMDRDRLFMLLDGFFVPGDSTRSLASVVERDPMAIVGNSIVYRVSAGAFLDIGAHGSPEKLKSWYMKSQSPREPIRVSLPTSGLYAKALMDKCNACEEHMGSVDWVLTDKEPELEAIGVEGLQSRRSEATGLTPTPFQAPIINLQNAPAAPQPTGLGSMLEAITKGDAFRDMAGLAGTQASAVSSMQAAASLASEFGSKALELQKSKQATESAPQKLSNIKRAQEDGLIQQDDATDLTKNALKEMNVSPTESRLTTEPVVQKVLNRASDVPSNPIEISRGIETIKVGDTSKTSLLNEVNVNFASSASSNDISIYTKGILEDIMRNSGISSITITSTTRTSSDQARIMYDNLGAGNITESPEKITYWRGIYADSGDKVIDVYENNYKTKTKDEVITLMTAKIDEVGPTNVSNHIRDPKEINVFDVGKSSISIDKQSAFESEVKSDKRVSKIISEKDAFHIEILQPK